MGDKQENAGNADEMRQGLHQVWRYGLVGLINTSIDFTVTNILVLLTGAYGAVPLFFISLTACLIATLNGYRMNRSWTFGYQQHQISHRTRLKYFAVALLVLIVNTSVFLFVYQFLTDQFGFGRMLSVNLAKTLAVGTSAVVGFIGYRVSVFQPEVIQKFRQNFTFSEQSLGYSLWGQLGILLLFSALVRGIYLYVTTAMSGDAIGYAWAAQAIAKGDFAQVDLGWYNLFSLWQALFYLVGLNHIQSAIGASLVPGVLLFIPVTWIARRYYGEQVAWLVGALTIVHPRLMAYSCNGTPETFYLLLLTAGIAFCSYSGWQQTSYRICLLAGVCLGLYFCVRTEGVLLIALLAVGLVTLGMVYFSTEPQVVWTTHPFKGIGALLAGCVLVVVGYVALSESLVGSSGFYLNRAIFTKLHVEQFNPVSAAREAYGFDVQQTRDIRSELHPVEVLSMWVSRIPSYVLLMLQNMPGVLLTPLWLFAFLLPMFSQSKVRTLLPEWPWLVLLIVPFVLSAILFVEPRYLFPLIFPIHLFGVAGLVALAQFIGNQGILRFLYPGVAALLIVFGVTVALWRAEGIETAYSYQRALAKWVESNIPADDGIVGDGYGYVATTGFLSQHPTSARVIHYDPAKVVQFVRNANARWLILYEPFVAKVNPEMLPFFDFGLPHMTLVYETRDARHRRIQVYHLNP